MTRIEIVWVQLASKICGSVSRCEAPDGINGQHDAQRQGTFGRIGQRRLIIKQEVKFGMRHKQISGVQRSASVYVAGR